MQMPDGERHVVIRRRPVNVTQSNTEAVATVVLAIIYFLFKTSRDATRIAFAYIGLALAVFVSGSWWSSFDDTFADYNVLRWSIPLAISTTAAAATAAFVFAARNALVRLDLGKRDVCLQVLWVANFLTEFCTILAFWSAMARLRTSDFGSIVTHVVVLFLVFVLWAKIGRGVFVGVGHGVLFVAIVLASYATIVVAYDATSKPDVEHTISLYTPATSILALGLVVIVSVSGFISSIVFFPTEIVEING